MTEKGRRGNDEEGKAPECESFIPPILEKQQGESTRRAKCP
jgi:hypothetical protein